MIQQPTERVLRAILNLQSADYQAWEVFSQWIAETLADTRKSNDTLEGFQLFRSQGSAQTLSALQTIFKDAHELARQLASRAAAEKQTRPVSGDLPAGI